MCHQPTARPPLPPTAGGAGVESRSLTLPTADGNRFAAFSALADRPAAPGVVIMPDVRGLHPFYKDLAVRFAEAGVHAVDIDYFCRTAGAQERDDEFEYRPHIEQTTPETIAMDVAAAVAYLRSSDGGEVSRVFTVGFCFGGRNSFNQAAEDHGLDGVIGFYGSLREWQEGDPNTPARRAPEYRSPVLGLFGGADTGIPPEQIEAFRSALDESGVEHDLVVYEGAPHSFFDRTFDQFRQQCEDAWRRVLSFVGEVA